MPARRPHAPLFASLNQPTLCSLPLHITCFLSTRTITAIIHSSSLLAAARTPPVYILPANGRVLSSIGCGDVLLEVPNGMGFSKFKLKNVAHALSIAFMLISIGRLDDAGCSTAEFTANPWFVRNSAGKIMARIPKTNGLYHISPVHMVQSDILVYNYVLDAAYPMYITMYRNPLEISVSSV
jgi:hypothetical protein